MNPSKYWLIWWLGLLYKRTFGLWSIHTRNDHFEWKNKWFSVFRKTNLIIKLALTTRSLPTSLCPFSIFFFPIILIPYTIFWCPHYSCLSSATNEDWKRNKFCYYSRPAIPTCTQIKQRVSVRIRVEVRAIGSGPLTMMPLKCFLLLVWCFLLLVWCFLFFGVLWSIFLAEDRIYIRPNVLLFPNDASRLR